MSDIIKKEFPGRKLARKRKPSLRLLINNTNKVTDRPSIQTTSNKPQSTNDKINTALARQSNAGSPYATSRSSLNDQLKPSNPTPPPPAPYTQAMDRQRFKLDGLRNKHADIKNLAGAMDNEQKKAKFTVVKSLQILSDIIEVLEKAIPKLHTDTHAFHAMAQRMSEPDIGPVGVSEGLRHQHWFIRSLAVKHPSATENQVKLGTLDDHPYVRMTANARLDDMFRKQGRTDINKAEPVIHNPVHHSEFLNAIQRMRQSGEQFKNNLHQYNPDEYAAMKTFLAPDKQSGYALKHDGELVNVFSNVIGRGDQVVQHAISQGAKHLDAFDGHLPKLYGRHGFKEYKREPNYNAGGPDVVYMKR
jgi:hypothetical protein